METARVAANLKSLIASDDCCLPRLTDARVANRYDPRWLFPSALFRGRFQERAL
jgi:hypothetical protein